MNVVKKMICVVLVLAFVFCCCACGKSGSGGTDSGVGAGETSTEDLIRAAVETRAMTVYFGMTIGGNELKSSRATITNVKKVSDTAYNVSGKIVVTDVYGTTWNNTFDCSVTQRSGSWSAGSLNYTSKNWTKG